MRSDYQDVPDLAPSLGNYLETQKAKAMEAALEEVVRVCELQGFQLSELIDALCTIAEKKGFSQTTLLLERAGDALLKEQ